MRGWRAACVIAVAAGSAALLPGNGAAATASPKILSMNVVGVAQPAPLGSRPTLVVRVRGARTCLFRAQHEPGSALYPVRTVLCAGGVAQALMPPVRSPYTTVSY